VALRVKTVRTTSGTKPQKNDNDGTQLTMRDRMKRPVGFESLLERGWGREALKAT